MKCWFGTDDSIFMGRKQSISVEELADRIKEEADEGRWNTYNGGRSNSITACCLWSERGKITHDRLFIQGARNEIQSLEKQLEGIITVIPREYDWEWEE